MRGVWVGLWSVVLGCGSVLLLVGCAGEPSKTVSKKYTALIHTDEGEQEQIYDAGRPAEAEKLKHLLTAGEVEELKKEREVNILAIRWDLGLWTAVVFVLLLLVLRRLAWKPMLTGLERRESNIREALEEARRSREESQRMQAQLQAQLNQAQEKVQGILEEARRRAQETTDDMVAKARNEIQIERERLRREIDLARDQALQELWSQAAQLATLISAKAIRRQLTAEDHRRLVDEAIADLRQASSERHQPTASI
jgi:F-type H+-transporting ATPase subunit b